MKYQSEEEKIALQNVKKTLKLFFYESREAAIKLFKDYSSIVYEVKYKIINGNGNSSMSARIARDHVAKVYDSKVSDHLNPKLVSTEQMFQRFINNTCTSKSR